MSRRIYLVIAVLLAAMIGAYGCRSAPAEVSTETPVPAEETEPPQPTATPEATEVVPTEEPTPEPTEPEPSPTEPETSPTVTPEPEEPTATPEPAEPTATAEPATELPDAEGEVLLEQRCTVCHTLDRVERAQKTREEWVTTVERMIGLGAQLSESEKTVLVDYLTETYGP